MQGDEDGFIDEWSIGLAGVTGEQIKNGLEAWDEEWPPSLSEFKNACLGKFNGKNEFGLDYVPEYHRTPIGDKSMLLSSDERNRRREIGKANIADIKRYLNKGRGNS